MVPLGETGFTVYTGLLALLANIVVAVIVNAVVPARAAARA
jgi:SSS family solute:Na+ symporter